VPDQIPHRYWPCDGCPWRTDNTGVRKTYSNLAAYAAGTCGQPGAEAPLGADMFGCHQSRADPAELCAGWLAAAGYRHLTVRYAVITGHLPDTVLVAGDGWPVLFPSLAAMLAAQEGLIDA
jgi:Family of unknown function (DUF6283)